MSLIYFAELRVIYHNCFYFPPSSLSPIKLPVLKFLIPMETNAYHKHFTTVSNPHWELYLRRHSFSTPLPKYSVSSVASFGSKCRVCVSSDTRTGFRTWRTARLTMQAIVSVILSCTSRAVDFVMRYSESKMPLEFEFCDHCPISKKIPDDTVLETFSCFKMWNLLILKATGMKTYFSRSSQFR